ncbi:MAG: histidinol-phosphatase [Rhodospirillales bacterium]|nr:histidinol-phosphatase [Rhodospirillales bacterium]
MMATTTDSDLTRFAEIANRLADAAGAVAMGYFRAHGETFSKDDESPVTVADREAELAMRAILETECPEHGIYGEEHGQQGLDSEFVWVLDPIDGTKSFVIGKPLFGTLIALTHRGQPVLGIINCPALNDRWIGIKGRRSTLNGAAIRTRPCADIGSAWLGSTGPQYFGSSGYSAFEKVSRSVRDTVWGGDCHSYGLLAAGTLDLVIESGLKVYDHMALIPVIEGAGGTVTDWRGNPMNMESAGDILAAGDPALHGTALELLTA